MSKKALHDLRDMLCKEIDKIAAKGSMSSGDLETVHKLTDTVKNIDKIEMLDGEGGYSQAGNWEAEMRGDYGHSNARRGEHYVRGHYSRTGDDYSRNRDGYSNTGRYSRERAYARDSMIEKLRKMHDEAGTEDEKDAIRRCMDELR